MNFNMDRRVELQRALDRDRERQQSYQSQICGTDRESVETPTRPLFRTGQPIDGTSVPPREGAD